MQALEFIPVSEYAAFQAEFAIEGGDLIFHFFPPTVSRTKIYWENSFPEALSPIAKAVFRAEYPALKAMRVYDLGIDSWWMRAYGFARVPDPRALAYRFFDALELVLDKKKEM